MNLKGFCNLLTIPDPKITDEGTSPPSRKEKVIEAFVFLALLTIVTSTILLDESFINKILVVVFVAVLLYTLLRKAKKYSAQAESPREMNLIYAGAFAVFVSLIFFSLWVWYCQYEYTYSCQYVPYILCGEVALIFILVVFVYRKM